ncbi:MAG: histidine kinase, partial [candidate division Zixibacteria bacterium]|nr:histidine kinase [candidate division Zixibacteria bacterium]
MKPEIDLKDFEKGSARFDSLMPYKVKDILLVSSLYDMYILREDGQLAYMVLSEYAEFNLSNAPSIKRVGTGEEALEALKENKFDLVIIFRSLSDIDSADFSHKAKKIWPDIPIVLLAFHTRELELMREKGGYLGFDKAFIWSGESQIFLAIIKYIEDKKNVEADTALVGVRVIILVEDSVRFYSSYLPLIYTEIMRQTADLMSESLNTANRLLRMRARPKILLADCYEEALELFKKHKRYLLGLISDIRFPKDGKADSNAGIQLVQELKKEIEDLPILLQSSDDSKAEIAKNYGISFLNKKSPTLLNDLSAFIFHNFGFGEFVFKMPDGTELARANSFRAMEKCFGWVDAKSLIYHANNNHYSNWLLARTEFDLALRIRPRKAAEFDDDEKLRDFLINTFRDFRHEKQLGVVTDFSREHYDNQADFVRIGNGSLGGKGRGLAFVNSLLNRYHFQNDFEGAKISVPSSAVIGTSGFDQFMESNNLTSLALGDSDDKEIADAFINASLPHDLTVDLKAYLKVADYPLAVRSSSLLEDSHYQPFAGIFDTHFLPNSCTSFNGRLERLEAAIKYIYASVFFKNSKNYIEATGNRTEEEKMAIVLQKTVGENHDGYFYPVLSGIARSYNFYSIGRIKPEEGIAYVALGMGRTVVEGENCLFFSPSNPQILPQFSTAQDYLKKSQYDFFAIDMRNPDIFPEPGGEAGQIKLHMTEADEHGVLKYIGSTYSADNDRIYPGVGRKGARIITFDPILKSKIFPLDEILKFLLQLGSSAMNVPVEMEFAAELNSDPNKRNEFQFLQIRPMAVETTLKDISFDDTKTDNVLCKSEQALSNGRITDIQDIVYVRTDSFDRSETMRIAEEVGDYNEYFKEKDIPYMLIGPGRWGTSDRWLGIPTNWRQISSARVIVEAAY